MVSSKIFECDRYKKLYEEEKKKNEELERQIKKLHELLLGSMEIIKEKKKVKS